MRGTQVLMLRTVGPYKIGHIYMIDPYSDEWKNMPKDAFGFVEDDAVNVVEPKKSQPQPEQPQHAGEPSGEPRQVDMDSEDFQSGVILETGVPLEFNLLSTQMKEYTYEGAENDFKRYELSIEVDGQETTIRVPPSVVAMIKTAINRNDLRPVEKKKPRFVLSKTGEGMKTKYSLNYLKGGK